MVGGVPWLGGWVTGSFLTRTPLQGGLGAVAPEGSRASLSCRGL